MSVRSWLDWRRAGFVATAVAIVLSIDPALAQRQRPSPQQRQQQQQQQQQTQERAGPPQQEAPESSPDRLIDDALMDPAKIEAAKRTMEQPLPAGDDPARLSTFHYERGMAAMTLGRQALAIREFHQAADQAARGRNLEASFIWEELARAYIQSARPVSAYKAIQQAVASVADGNPVRLIALKGFMVNLAATAGDLDAADKIVEELRSDIAQMSNMRQFQRAMGKAQSSLLRAEAGLLEARGKYPEAEQLHRKIIANIEQSPRGPSPAAVARRMALSRNLTLQGRLGEAETEIRRALIEAQRQLGPKSFVTGSVLQNLAQSMVDQNRLADAEQLLAKATEITEKTGVHSGGRVHAALYAAQGRWQEAADQFAKIKASRDAEDFEAFAHHQPLYGLVMIKAGHATEMVERLEAQVEFNHRNLGDKHFATAEARGLLAMAHAVTGQEGQALREFSQALPILTSASRAAEDSEGGQSGRDYRVRQIMEAYMDLLAKQQQSGDLSPGIDAVGTTFILAETARGRSVERALAASAARAAAGNPALADLVRQLQDSEKQIAALNTLLANAISSRADEQNPATTQSLRVRIDKLRDLRGSLSQTLEQRFPDFAALVNPKPASIESVRRALRSGEALLSFYSSDTRTYTWSVSADGVIGFHAASLGFAAVSNAVAAIRRTLEPSGDSIDSVPVFDLPDAYKLYSELLAPLGPLVTDAKHLLIVPHGALGELPLGLLVTAPPPAMTQGAQGQPAFAAYRTVAWLIRKAAVTQLPSAVALPTLRALPAGPADRQAFLGFGDPWFSTAQATEAQAESIGTQLALRGGKLKLRSAPPPSQADLSTVSLEMLPRLPETANEVRNIAAALKADPLRDTRLGREAARNVVLKADLAHRRVLMFATHGLIPGDIEGLDQPALALSGTAVTGVAGDGLLTAADILGLKLNADWVVLSACNTAAGSGAGSEAVSGLGRAFFYAGTRALLVSNWPVETTSAARLTTDLFRRQAENAHLSRAEALQQAMLALMDGPGSGDFSYAHPIFWAPFSLVGDGG